MRVLGLRLQCANDPLAQKIVVLRIEIKPLALESSVKPDVTQAQWYSIGVLEFDAKRPM